MSDILILAVKEHLGKIKSDESGLAANTTGDLATLTANSGKDMYLAKAHANVALDGLTNHSGTGTIVLKVNNTIVDTWNFALAITAGEAPASMDSHEFLVGFKAGTGEIIKLECTVAGTSVLTEGQIECFEEDTGVNPLDDFK